MPVPAGIGRSPPQLSRVLATLPPTGAGPFLAQVVLRPVMPRSSRSLLLASLAAGTATAGAVLAYLALAGPFDPRAAAGGVLAAAALSLSLLALAWARRRAQPGPGARADRGDGRPSHADEPRPGLALVPLGDGEAALIYDEPRAGGRPAQAGQAPPAAGREAAATADAIWDAVDAAVEAAAGPPAGSAPPAPPARSRLKRALGRARPTRPRPSPGDGGDTD